MCGENEKYSYRSIAAFSRGVSVYLRRLSKIKKDDIFCDERNLFNLAADVGDADCACDREAVVRRNFFGS